jgi:hypothetical protein
VASRDHRHQDLVEDVTLPDDAPGDLGTQARRGREQRLAPDVQPGRNGGVQRTRRFT